jgi:hypothetical protein
MQQERERLNKEREKSLSKRATIDMEISVIDKELKAIDAYEAAKLGKPARVKGTGTRRGSRQDGILAILKDAPDGMGRADILDKLGLKGNKTGEQSISNALNNMKKAGKIGSKEGRYTLA